MGDKRKLINQAIGYFSMETTTLTLPLSRQRERVRIA